MRGCALLDRRGQHGPSHVLPALNASRTNTGGGVMKLAIFTATAGEFPEKARSAASTSVSIGPRHR